MTNAAQSEPSATPGARHFTGSCHCGAVEFQVELGPNFQGSRCNCSICTKLGGTGCIVKPAMFKLVRGQEQLASYEWGARISKRYFCKHCGTHCYGVGFLEYVGGDFVSVNLNVLDGLDVNELSLVYWDGRHDNWFAGARSTPWPLHAPVA
jgi:hypothetical protein